MAKATEKHFEWDKQPRMPVPAPPAGSCDCQFHIYADPAKFPPRTDPPYPPIESATFDAAQRTHKAIGFEHGVIVHSAIYGSDHRLLLHALENLNDRDRYRGIGIVDDRVSDKELERMHAAGVRGARFNFVRFLTLDQREAEVRRSMARLRELGWHARLHVNGDDLLENSHLLRSLKDVPMVIDHFGHVGFAGGMNRPVIRWVLDMLKQENWWMMVSNGNRDSKMDSGWDDAIPYGRAFVGAAPDRIVWGTDWPHPQWPKRMMNDAEEVELLYRYVDGDPALLKKILVDNPARLHGFKI
ncbi:MAG TPA: amidohydrolase family protein [Terriglobales bacterium]|nr:amidohydrolase family protein [Terriglobales bacterium]